MTVTNSSNLKPLYIIGAGGFGREVAWLVERVNAVESIWDFKGFIDDDESLWGKEADGYRIHGASSVLERSIQDVWCVVAVGNSQVRRKAISRLKRYKHIHFATLIDPTVLMSSRVVIEEGTIICAGTIITVDVHIGTHNIINLDCTIGHDALLDDYVTLYPSVNISGYVSVGECTEIGTGTQIVQGVSIGRDSIVGAGSVVIRNIEDSVTVVGSPTRVIKKHNLDKLWGIPLTEE